MTTPNYLDSNGFYFAGALSIKPGQNMLISELTPQQAKIILKSDLVNKMPKEDLDEITALANKSASYNSLPQPTREGQIITSRVVDGKLEITWDDLTNVPLESSPFIGTPVVPLPGNQNLWEKEGWKTVNATISQDTITYTGGTYTTILDSVTTSERLFALDYMLKKGDEFAVQVSVQDFSEFSFNVDCYPEPLEEPFSASFVSDLSGSIELRAKNYPVKLVSYANRSFVEERPYLRSTVNLYAKYLEDSSFTLGIIDNDGKVVKQFNAYGINDSTTLRLIGRVAEGKEQVTLKKGLIALVSDYKQEITEPFEEPPTP